MNLEIKITYGDDKVKCFNKSCSLSSLRNMMDSLTEDIIYEVTKPTIAEDIEKVISILRANLLTPRYLLLSPKAEEQLDPLKRCPKNHFKKYLGLTVIIDESINGFSIGV